MNPLWLVTKISQTSENTKDFLLQNTIVNLEYFLFENELQAYRSAEKIREKFPHDKIHVKSIQINNSEYQYQKI